MLERVVAPHEAFSAPLPDGVLPDDDSVAVTTVASWNDTANEIEVVEFYDQNIRRARSVAHTCANLFATDMTIFSTINGARIVTVRPGGIEEWWPEHYAP